jgi:hypothetical protein
MPMTDLTHPEGALSAERREGLRMGPGSLRHRGRIGVAANELTSLRHRDWLAGAPGHRHVPARLEAVA